MLNDKQIREENIILFRFNTYDESTDTYDIISYYAPAKGESNEYLKILNTAISNNIPIEIVNGNAYESGKLYKIKDISLVLNSWNIPTEKKVIPYINVIIEEEY